MEGSVPAKPTVAASRPKVKPFWFWLELMWWKHWERINKGRNKGGNK
jgi:hypothetical protein